MEKELYYKNAFQLLQLIRCAISNKQPESELITTLDLDMLFQVCQSHSLTACAAYALESAGVKDQRFTIAKEKAIRKNILLDAERIKILRALEKSGIWYMPLKGSILKDLYPKIGMRQMSDNDILFDAAYGDKVRDIMLSMGYEISQFGKGNHDEYIKPPVYNFELHRELFSKVVKHRELYLYYHNIVSKLQQDDNAQFGRHFTLEDFYLYMVAHEYKHFCGGGTGIRSLIDIYIFLKKYNFELDWDYINTELEVLALTEFEQQNRSLAQHLLDDGVLSDEEQKRLEYYIFSGTYGTVSNSVNNEIQRMMFGSRLIYIFKRIFPPLDWIEMYYPFFYRHKMLIPLLLIIRPVRGIIKNRKKLISECRGLFISNYPKNRNVRRNTTESYENKQ